MLTERLSRDITKIAASKSDELKREIERRKAEKEKSLTYQAGKAVGKGKKLVNETIDSAKQLPGKAVKKFEETAKPVLDSVMGAGEAAFDGVGRAGRAVKDIGNTAIEGVGRAGRAVKDMGNAAIALPGKTYDATIDVGSAAIERAKQKLQNMGTSFSEGMAGEDSDLAMLEYQYEKALQRENADREEALRLADLYRSDALDAIGVRPGKLTPDYADRAIEDPSMLLRDSGLDGLAGILGRGAAGTRSFAKSLGDSAYRREALDAVTPEAALRETGLDGLAGILGRGAAGIRSFADYLSDVSDAERAQAADEARRLMANRQFANENMQADANMGLSLRDLISSTASNARDQIADAGASAKEQAMNALSTMKNNFENADPDNIKALAGVGGVTGLLGLLKLIRAARGKGRMPNMAAA